MRTIPVLGRTLALGLPLALLVLAFPARSSLVVVAPHPDDGEASCGGFVASSVAAGEEVVILTLTGGELGVYGKDPAAARAIRREEARRAAAVLGARAELLGGMDGSLVADGATTEKLSRALRRLRASVVLAPWPLDVHPDHQAAGLLAWRAFLARDASFALYFYETANLPHTTSQGFVPTDHVDVSRVLERKREATLRHVSQDPAAWFGMYEDLARVRGYEADVPLAEGYVRARASSGLGGRRAGTGTLLGPSRPAPSPSWSLLDRYRDANAQLGPPAAGETRVVFLGDSITEGWVRAMPSFFEGRPFVGRGISGQTTAQMLARFRQDVLALAPRVLVLLAGTNDVAWNNGPYDEEATVANIASMLELACDAAITPVLVSVLPAIDFPWRPGLDPAPAIVALDGRLRDLAARTGVRYVDLHRVMSDGLGGMRPGLADDGIHPSRRGYEVMGPLVEEAVRAASSPALP